MSNYETFTGATASSAGGVRVADRLLDLVNGIMARRSSAHPLPPVLLEAELREVGLTSLEMVNLMLAVEAEFDLKIPDADMTMHNFRSITSIEALVAVLMRANGGNSS